MLHAAFVRTVGAPDRIYVTRSDRSEVSWPFPTYGDGLPHAFEDLRTGAKRRGVAR